MAPVFRHLASVFFLAALLVSCRQDATESTSGSAPGPDVSASTAATTAGAEPIDFIELQLQAGPDDAAPLKVWLGMQPLPADGQWIGLIAQAVHTGMNTCAGTNHDAAAATPPASRQVLPRIDLAWQLRDGRLQPLEHTTATAAGDAIATATARLRACLIEAFADLDLTSLGPEPRELRVRLHASAP